MYKILTLNNISPKGLDQLPRDHYEIASEIKQPDAILVRSYNMHDMPISPTLKAIGRAGAGVNNIPVDRLSEFGIAVFNAPGANANAVKELVIAGMLLSARNICAAWDYTRHLHETGEELEQRVEAGKKRFAGFELPGRTLGVVGLGAIGVQVANAAHALGMKVIGCDPKITVQSAWRLSANVQQALNIDELLPHCDMLSFHVPLNEHTRYMLNAKRIASMKPGTVVLNFARERVVDEAAMIAGLDSGRLHGYVTDFPSERLIRHPKVIALPHLGASTAEAEDNCAVMVAQQVRDYLENGNLRNSVNLPNIELPRAGRARIAVINRNVPDMVGQISHALGKAGVNIVHMVNESRADLAYNLMDVECEVDNDTADTIARIDGVLKVRVL